MGCGNDIRRNDLGRSIIEKERKEKGSRSPLKLCIVAHNVGPRLVVARSALFHGTETTDS